MIFPVAVYGIETWSLILREDHRLRVFENMVLRGTFGLNRDKVTVKWRKLHNEELNDLYSSPNMISVIKSRRMRWTWHVARIGERSVLVRKPQKKRRSGRSRSRWEDNIRIDLQ
jgi:hypothetical protein